MYPRTATENLAIERVSLRPNDPTRTEIVSRLRLTLGDLLGELDSLRDLVVSGFNRTLDRSVCVCAIPQSATVILHVHRVVGNVRLFTDVKLPLEELDKTEFDSYVGISPILRHIY